MTRFNQGFDTSNTRSRFSTLTIKFIVLPLVLRLRIVGTSRRRVHCRFRAWGQDPVCICLGQIHSVAKMRNPVAAVPTAAWIREFGADVFGPDWPKASMPS